MKTFSQWALVLLVLLAVAGVLVGVPLLQGTWWASHFQHPADQALLVNEARRTLAQVLGGCAVLVGLYLGWQRLRIADAANRIAADARVVDSFIRAVEQLGSDALAIRVGALHALRRVVTVSPEDTERVKDVLNRFVFERQQMTSGNPAPLAETDVALALELFAELHRGVMFVTNTSLRSAFVRNLRLRNWRFHLCNLAGAKLVYSTFLQCEFVECSGPFEVMLSSLDRCRFPQQSGVVGTVRFIDCNLKECVFDGSSGGISFHGSDLVNCTIGPDMALVDLATARSIDDATHNHVHDIADMLSHAPGDAVQAYQVARQQSPRENM